jgi:hypothetical protein
MTVFRVLGGYMALFIITAAEAYLVFMAAGVYNYGLILALITALIDFMPVLGISATMIPVMIWLFLNGKIASVVIIIIGMAIMTVIRRFIEPPILGKSMHIHPLLTLIAMAAGVYIWGAIGFLLGPALAIIILQIIKVFEIDKKVGDYLSGIFERFFASKDGEKETGKKKKGGKEVEVGDGNTAAGRTFTFLRKGDWNSDFSVRAAWKEENGEERDAWGNYQLWDRNYDFWYEIYGNDTVYSDGSRTYGFNLDNLQGVDFKLVPEVGNGEWREGKALKSPLRKETDGHSITITISLPSTAKRSARRGSTISRPGSPCRSAVSR